MLNSQYEQFAYQRGINHLVHFTKSSCLPYIFGNNSETNGILSSDLVENEFGNQHVYDKKRFDNHRNYVCCSVSRINNPYYRRRKRQQEIRGDIFLQWAVVLIAPQIIDDTTRFCQCNAATKGGSLIKGSIDGFKKMFDDSILRKYRGQYTDKLRKPNTPLNFTTDVQAEVLVKNKVNKDMIMGVAFPPASAEVEKERLKFWSTGIRVYDWNDVFSEEEY